MDEGMQSRILKDMGHPRNEKQHGERLRTDPCTLEELYRAVTREMVKGTKEGKVVVGREQTFQGKESARGLKLMNCTARFALCRSRMQWNEDESAAERTFEKLLQKSPQQPMILKRRQQS